jgi:predicted dehydrogenase
VSGAGCLHPHTGVDAWAVGTLAFAGGIVASLSAGVGVNQENVVRIYGTEGRLILPDPYVPAREGAVPGRLVVMRDGESARELIVDSPVTSFTHEADVCGAAIRSGQLEASAMLWEDTLGNMRTLEAWRATC